jgi:hypothetical protein
MNRRTATSATGMFDEIPDNKTNRRTGSDLWRKYAKKTVRCLIDKKFTYQTDCLTNFRTGVFQLVLLGQKQDPVFRNGNLK